MWSETRWNCCWSPDAGVGLYIHAGRFREDVDLWWVQSVAYLPDGRLAVDRAWCRNDAPAGVRSDNLDLTMTATGWRALFDGVGELTTTTALARATRGSAAPSVPVRWDVTATAAAPLWDMYSTVAGVQDFASDLHLQQASATTGSLWVGGVEYPLDGVGFKDHSSGVRTWANWHSHRFLVAAMPGYAVHAVTIFGPDGTPTKPFGALMVDGVQRPIEQFELPPLAEAHGAPADQELVVTGPGGPIRLRAELIHALPMTITEDNDNLNGIDWDIAGDPIVMIEGIARLTGPDGAVGYGFLERSARRSALPRP